MLAVSDATTITISVVGFFVFLALVTFLRLLLRKEAPSWRKISVGFFVERTERPEDEPYAPLGKVKE